MACHGKIEEAPKGYLQLKLEDQCQGAGAMDWKPRDQGQCDQPSRCPDLEENWMLMSKDYAADLRHKVASNENCHPEKDEMLINFLKRLALQSDQGGCSSYT